MSEGRIITVQCPECTQVFHVDPLDIEPGITWVCEPCQAKPNLSPVVRYHPMQVRDIETHRYKTSMYAHDTPAAAQRICDGIAGTPHVVVEVTTTYRLVSA